MFTPPVDDYEVKFIPLERRLIDRRRPSAKAANPLGMKKERRRTGGRRGKGVSRPPNFMVQVALAALRGDKTPEELTKQFDVHPDQISNWKNWLLDWIEQVFGNMEGEGAQDKD